MFLTGKRVAVFGVANEYSISWAITKQIIADGGEVILGCQPPIVQKGKVQQLAATEGITTVLPCDVMDPTSMDTCFNAINGPIHGIVHGIAHSDKRELSGKYLDTSRENFAVTLLASCFSLTEITRRALPFMLSGGSIVTLTFDASRGTYPNYNVMGVAKAALEASVRYLATDLGELGIRVNAISSGPQKTLASAGIGGREQIGEFGKTMSLLGGLATREEVARTAVFLLSDWSSGTTGDIIMVDRGAHAARMPPIRNR